MYTVLLCHGQLITGVNAYNGNESVIADTSAQYQDGRLATKIGV